MGCKVFRGEPGGMRMWGLPRARADLPSGFVMKEQTEGGNLRVEKRPLYLILKIIS